jgi:polyisoprenyl-phosphate glycosyltransferase
MATARNSLALLCPVYNDWRSLTVLIEHLDKVLEDCGLKIDLFVVDDGSTIRVDLTQIPITRHIQCIECLSLVTNMGHQRAIAVGLCEIEKRGVYDAVIILDSDGEDRPDDVLRLLKAHHENPNFIVVAQRIARSEGAGFKFFYFFYKKLFQFLTGQAIDFGNFSLIPAAYLGQINAMPETWNHLAASIVRSRIPLMRVPTSRAKRYAGSSSMNFIALVLHGLGGMSVFIDVFLVRLLMILSSLGGLGIVIAVSVLLLRPQNPGWDPAWFNLMLGFGCILITQIITFALVTLFITLSQRNTQKLPLSMFSSSYIREVVRWKQ